MTLHAITPGAGVAPERTGRPVVAAAAAALFAGMPIDFSSVLLHYQVHDHTRYGCNFTADDRPDLFGFAMTAPAATPIPRAAYAAPHRLAHVAWTGYHARAFRAAAPAVDARRATRVSSSHPGKDNNHGP
jgi:hypothetical protein